MYPLAPGVREAFDESTRLAVEVNVLDTPPAAVARAVAENGTYVDGVTLREQVSRETWDALGSIADRYGLPVDHFLPQKPWLVGLTLTALDLRSRGFRQELGVDLHFLRLAKGQKEIIELETFSEQMDLLNGFPAEDQELLLVDTLDDLRQGGALLDRLVQGWIAGDTKAIHDLLNDKLSALGREGNIYDKLLLRRNRAMTRKVENLLASPGAPSFVVVGAGHLVGEGSMVDLLRERGYTVQKLSGAGSVHIVTDSPWQLRPADSPRPRARMRQAPSARRSAHP